MAGLPGFKGDGIPVVPGKLHGIRSFDVDVNKGTLHGVSFNEAWNGDENVATCHDENNKHKIHSMGDCDHGYWCYFGVKSPYMENYRAHAIIEGYGEVIVGEEGFRAEKAKIKAITVPSLKDIASHKEHHKECLAWCAKSNRFTPFFQGITFLSFGIFGMVMGRFSTFGLFSGFESQPPTSPNIVLTGSIIAFSLFMFFVSFLWLFDAKEHNEEYKTLTQEIADMKNSKPANWAVEQKELEARIQENYPNAIIYPSLKEMVVDNKDNIILHGMLLSA